MKAPSSALVLNLLVALALLAAAAWLADNTEWVDAWQRQPPRREAARDELYALKQLVTRLGAQVTSPANFDHLPPAGATLVLVSRQWDFMPGRDAQLRRWVEAGGHLVLPAFFVTGNEIDWLPVREVERPKAPPQKAPAAARKPPLRKPAGPRFVGPDGEAPACPSLREVRTDEAVDPNVAARMFRVCSGNFESDIEAAPAARALWALQTDRGSRVLRVALGEGRVTAISSDGLLKNFSLFHGDHAQLAIAALDLQPRAQVWFVVDERRDALLVWLWQRGGPAIALAALALALALWRGALRFGPLLPQAPGGRRSVAEQVRGTAAFVLRAGGGAPLLAASRRALDEAARQRVVGYDQYALTARAAALARPTGLPADALLEALDPRRPLPRGRAMADTLALLESARRRLVLNPSASASA